MLRKALTLLRSVLDPRPYLFLLRLVHFYNYDRVAPARAATIGAQVGLPPTVSLRNGERLTIGDRCRIGSFSVLWAGERASITIGPDTLFGPRVFVTVANYGLEPGTPPMHQSRTEADVAIGAGCWLGTGVTVLPGVTIGDGAVVGAGAVVAKDVPANAIVVGTAARVLRER